GWAGCGLGASSAIAAVVRSIKKASPDRFFMVALVKLPSQRESEKHVPKSRRTHEKSPADQFSAGLYADRSTNSRAGDLGNSSRVCDLNSQCKFSWSSCRSQLRCAS